MTPVKERDKVKALERLSKQERIVLWDEKGKFVIPFDPERHSVMLRSQRVVLRWDGAFEIYRLKHVEVTREGDKVFTDYVVGECLLCREL